MCVSLIGCTTSAWKQADAYANRESKYWTIEDVTFAAIRDHRFVRLCVNLQHFSEEAVTEVNIDLQQVANKMNNLGTTVSSIEEGGKLEKFYKPIKRDNDNDDEGFSLGPYVEEIGYAACMTELKKNEETLPIIIKKTDGFDMSPTLLEIGEEPPDHPALFLIEHGDVHYIIFGAPMQMYSDMIDHSFRCYAEDQSEPSRYFLVPLAFAGDVMFVLTMVMVGVVCVLLLPICIYEIATNDRGPSTWPGNMERFYSLPPDTLKPECN